MNGIGCLSVEKLELLHGIVLAPPLNFPPLVPLLPTHPQIPFSDMEQSSLAFSFVVLPAANPALKISLLSILSSS